MKILHTSDWHVGKVLKGRDRHDEHVAVLRGIVQAARDENVDLVLVAGDLFETAAPNPKAQGLVMQALLALREFPIFPAHLSTLCPCCSLCSERAGKCTVRLPSPCAHAVQ